VLVGGCFVERTVENLRSNTPGIGGGAKASWTTPTCGRASWPGDRMQCMNDLEATGLPLRPLLYFGPPRREMKREAHGQ